MDQRSSKAEEYHRWYNTPEWKRLRRDQLRDHPLCRMCQAEGKATRATVCDHVSPHRGNSFLFWNGPFQSLCAEHHNFAKREIEFVGYSTDVASNGVPTDKRHPFNK